jgi:cytochrome c oxidase subunit 1
LLLDEIRIEPRDKRLLGALSGTGIAVLAIAGALALLVVLVRTPGIPLSSPTLYYRALTGHATLMFIYWLGFIQTLFLLIAGSVLIGRPLWSHKLAWVGFGVMVAAAASNVLGVLSGADILYTAAAPLAKNYSGAWLIYLGFLLFSVGMSLMVIDFILTIFSAVEHKGEFASWAAFLRDIPIASFAAIAGLLIAIPGLILSFKVFIPAFLWSVGVSSIDVMSYRMGWHIIFHIYHYMPALALVGVAYVLVELTCDARSVYAKQIAKALFLLYPFFVPPTFLYHLLVDPNIPQGVKFTGTTLSLLIGTPTVLHMFIILGMLEARMRSAGHSLFGWFRHLPWGNPAFGSLVMGMVTLLTGGLLSYVLIQEQLSPMLHNTFAVPAYIHPMAAGGANIIYMGAVYYGVTLLTGRQLWGLRLAKLQPYLMAVALLIMAIGGSIAGYAGVPRRVPIISYGGDAPAAWSVLMNITLGVGGLLAIAAGVIFVLVIGMTAFAGRKVPTLSQAIRGLEPPLLPVKEEYQRTPVALLPGAIFIAGIVIFTLFAFNMLNTMPIQLR